MADLNNDKSDDVVKMTTTSSTPMAGVLHRLEHVLSTRDEIMEAM